MDPSRAQFSASAVLALPHTGDMSPGGWPAWGFRRVCGRQVDVPWKHGVWYTYCMAYIITRGIAKLPCKHCDALSKWPPPRRCSRTPSPAKPAGAQEILRIFVAEFQKFLISKCPGQRRHQRERSLRAPAWSFVLQKPSFWGLTAFVLQTPSPHMEMFLFSLSLP